MLISGMRHGLRVSRGAVIKPIHLFFYFGGKADSMQFIATPQTTHGFADLTDFTNSRMCIAILDIDAGARLDAFGRVIAIVRNVARTIFDEIVFGKESSRHHDGTGGRQKLLPFVFRHVEIDRLTKPASDEPLA